MARKNRKKKTRVQKALGSSMMVPPEKEAALQPIPLAPSQPNPALWQKPIPLAPSQPKPAMWQTPQKPIPLTPSQPKRQVQLPPQQRAGVERQKREQFEQQQPQPAHQVQLSSLQQPQPAHQVQLSPQERAWAERQKREQFEQQARQVLPVQLSPRNVSPPRSQELTEVDRQLREQFEQQPRQTEPRRGRAKQQERGQRKQRRKQKREQRRGQRRFAEGGLLAETGFYLDQIEVLENSESTDKQRAMAQATLETLQSSDKGGTVDPQIYAQMMQEVDAERAKNDEAATSEKVKMAGGSSMLVPPEMEGAPVDTYPNIPPEDMAEVEASQLPDEEVESDYVDFVMNEALEQEEQSYLMNALESDPELSMIFDKVIDTASEFSGAGEVDGPGDGVSDSIPARLSAGEFVVTKKATDQLGADNLQTMMDEAERAYDGGLMGGDKAIAEKDDYINESMLSSNQMPSLNIRKR